MTISLHPDNCREYFYWHEYFKDKKESAVYDFGEMFGIAYGLKSKWAYDHLNSTKRNSFNRSMKLGYQSKELTWDERTYYLDDIHAINTSLLYRQGKPLADSYREYPKAYRGIKKCDHHYGSFIGCFTATGRLVAYITTNFCGHMAAASQIMGHAAYLKDGIMVNVWLCFANLCLQRGVKAIVYSRWDDGQKGLQDWKKAVGMKAFVLDEAHIDNPKLTL